MYRAIAGTFVLGVLVGIPSAAQAQINPGYSRYMNPAAGVANNAIYNRPTVSPYLNLLRPQGGVAIPNYQSLVRPMLDQERINQQQGRQLQQLQKRIYQGPSSQSSAGAPIGIRSTGHTTGFMNYSAYFPQLQSGGAPPQRRAQQPR